MEPTTVTSIWQTSYNLRHAQANYFATHTQSDVVAALVEWASRWHDPQSDYRLRAAAISEPFDFSMVRGSLDALLESMTPDAVEALIVSEGAQNARGPHLIGHVIAGNTPLLAWVSAIRSLLVGSAALLKLPSGEIGAWGRLFEETLRDVDADLAMCIKTLNWQGGVEVLDQALCNAVDFVIAYGSDHTIDALRALCSSEKPILGYGHRVSFGLVLKGQGNSEAADGLAADVLLYDQGGCLSPHTVYIEGDYSDTMTFAALLSSALKKRSQEFPLRERTLAASMAVREARMLACMEPEVHVWSDPNLQWTVIARAQSTFTLSPTYGVISVQPINNLQDLEIVLRPVRNMLQGCAVTQDDTETATRLSNLGTSRICAPGQLQMPPLAWRQDNVNVLNSLRPAEKVS